MLLNILFKVKEMHFSFFTWRSCIRKCLSATIFPIISEFRDFPVQRSFKTFFIFISKFHAIHKKFHAIRINLYLTLAYIIHSA